MGGALAEGLLKSEKFTPSDITVSDHNQPVLDHFASEGASVTLDNQIACHGADIVCVVVKPWCVEKTLKGIKDVLDYKSQKLVVVAAGVPSASIKEWLDKDGLTPAFFLVMPNIAIAYAMRYVRANVEGGVEMGFKAKDAQKIVLQTVKGAVELLQETGEHPEAAIDKVTTPGGCTIKGLNTMEQGGFTSAVINGLLAGKR